MSVSAECAYPPIRRHQLYTLQQAEMASEDVKLITFWASPYGLRAELALTAKGVPYQRLLEEDLFRNKSQLLLQSNPIHKKVPVLLHHAKPPLPESLLIIEYVDAVWPSPHGKDLLPADPFDRAMARFWSDFVEKKIGEASRAVLLSKGEAQKAAVEELMSSVATLEGVLEKASKGGPFFGGDHVGMVDVVLYPFFLWFPAYEVIGDFKFQFEERFPRLHSWSEAMKTSPCAPCIPDPEKLTEFVLNIRKMFVPN